MEVVFDFRRNVTGFLFRDHTDVKDVLVLRVGPTYCTPFHAAI